MYRDFGKEGLSVISFLIEIDLATGAGASELSMLRDPLPKAEKKEPLDYFKRKKEIGKYRRRKKKEIEQSKT